MVDKYKKETPAVTGISYLTNQKNVNKNLLPSQAIKLAKQVPLENQISSKVIRTGRLKMAKCPFHDDSTPSLAIYPTNSFYCFACGVGGDAIAFYMKLHNLDFKTAVKELAK